MGNLPVREPTGAQFVYVEPKRRIIELELQPGRRVYEPALAKELEVSRTPLREAIRRLISENLLEQQRTGGVVVPTLDAREIAELHDVRAAIEALMAGQACANMTPAIAAEMQGTVERNAALVSFADDALACGEALHAKVAQTADNLGHPLAREISNQVQRYRTVTNRTQDRRDAALDEHRTILDALNSGQATLASDLAYRHVVGARDEALRAIRAGAPG